MEEIVVEFAGQDFHKEADMCIIIVMSHGGLGGCLTFLLWLHKALV